MGKSHNFFATSHDTETIFTWLHDAEARQRTGEPIEVECAPEGVKVVCHFPSFGLLEIWHFAMTTPSCCDNGPRAKRTILAMLNQRENPGRPEIDVERSAVAGVKLPELHDGRDWVAGHIWFPTSKLKDVFPDLYRICGQLERFRKTKPKVFDNSKGEDASGCGYQICSSGIIPRIGTLSEGYALLKEGAFMVDHLTTSWKHSEFRHRLQRSGHGNFP